MNLQEQLDHERRIINAATDGPWAPWLDQDGTEHMKGMLMVGNAAAVIPEGETWIEGVDVNPVAHCYTPEDRVFIAHARTALPQRNAQLQAVLELVREQQAQGYNAVSLDHLTRAIEEATP